MAAKLTPLNAGWLLALIYAIGFAGFLIPVLYPYMVKLIWVNQMFTLIVLLAYHKKWGKEFTLSALLVSICGFLIEVIGVKTGLIFGYYQYGNVLGFNLWNTPVLMAVSWLLTVYTSRQIAETIAKDPFLISVLAAALMVLLDIFIEPFAIRTGMWIWNSGNAPVHNYIGWFTCGVLMQYLFIRAVKFPQNKLSLPVYLIQLSFFAGLYLLNR
jgi:putative membrane protein